MSKRKCMSCGASMPKGAFVCPRCHARAVDDVDMFDSIFRQDPAPAAAQSRKNKNASDESDGLHGQFWRIIVVLSVMAVLIVGAVVAFMVMQHHVRTAADAALESASIHLLDENGEEVEPTTAPQAADESDSVLPDDSASGEASDEMTEMDDTVYVISSGANLRAEPTTTAEVLASLSNGTELHRTGMLGDWCRVEYEGQAGYISDALISDSSDDVVASAQTLTVSAGHDAVEIVSDANARSGAGTGYSAVTVVTAGTILERTGTTGSWSAVLVNGQTLYINNNMLKTASSDSYRVASGDSESESTAADTTEDTADTAETTETAAAERTAETVEPSAASTPTSATIAAEANLRSGAGTGYGVVTVLQAGTPVSITGESGGWYAVSTEDNQSGYVYETMLSFD